MKGTINERIKTIIEKGEYRSATAFAKKIGVAQTTLHYCISGTTEPRMGLVAAILDSLPDLSAEWLMRGEGPMYRTGKPEAGHTVSGTGNAVEVSAGGSVTVSATQPEAASLKAEVERLRAVIGCKDGEIAFLRGIVMDGRKRG